MSPVRVVELPTPFPHQVDILNDDHPVKVVCGGRQLGKTFMGGEAALVGHGPTVVEKDDEGRVVYCGPKFKGALNGATIYWVTKDYPTSEKIWRDLSGYLVKWGGELAKNKMAHRIDFPGGGSLTIRSASDPDSLRGDTIDGLVGDEVAFWHPESLNVLRPALAVRRGWQLLISTPNGFDFFWEEWRKGDEKTDSDYRAWQLPSNVNPAFSAEEFEKARARTDAVTFAREYGAEFNVAKGSIFEQVWFRNYREDDNYFEPEIGDKVAKKDCRTFLSADFALTKRDYSDHTAIAAVSVAPDGRMFMRDMRCVKVSRGELTGRPKTDTDPGVPGLVFLQQEKWKAIFLYCESSGELANLNADLKKSGVRVLERKIHQKLESGKKGEDKVTRAAEASKAVEHAKIFFPTVKQHSGAFVRVKWASDLIAQCCAFTGEAGRPDDQVDALSLGVLGAPFLIPQKPQDTPPDNERPRGSWKIGRR